MRRKGKRGSFEHFLGSRMPSPMESGLSAFLYLVSSAGIGGEQPLRTPPPYRPAFSASPPDIAVAAPDDPVQFPVLVHVHQRGLAHVIADPGDLVVLKRREITLPSRLGPGIMPSFRATPCEGRFSGRISEITCCRPRRLKAWSRQARAASVAKPRRQEGRWMR